ncbi:hypothetical protein K470DRAFT_268646 [Piedraia hortae CBS 480.64]|uniref:Uncharacterized protein n=1 Tax=Piedraia hortae CBS 480.64 TaxID=1314780 RepID=A0A6A7C5G5_9PEZI|nr:hypothetical protein K470DRAFT_268646 [Piedraia hortae CBS 480.64]
MEDRTSGVAEETPTSQWASNVSDERQQIRNALTNISRARTRKRIPWRGKTCIVSIPDVDFKALGLPKPLTDDEIRLRLRKFEQLGYNLHGFDVQGVLARPIYPEERAKDEQQRPTVRFPDFDKWKAHEAELMEQRLAALGVELARDEPNGRLNGHHYPYLSARSYLNESVSLPPMVRGHSHAMTMASPSSPASGLGHVHGFAASVDISRHFGSSSRNPSPGQFPGIRQGNVRVPSPLVHSGISVAPNPPFVPDQIRAQMDGDVAPPNNSDIHCPSSSETDGIYKHIHKPTASLNVAAPAFQPNSDFNFPGFENAKKLPNTPDGGLPSIFGRVNVPRAKTTRKSKAVPIVPPSDDKEADDEDGRVKQSDDRIKRQRKFSSANDEVPLFAEQPPADATSDPEEAELAARAAELEPPVQNVMPAVRGHKQSSSLSALAAPFVPITSAFSNTLEQFNGNEVVASEKPLPPSPDHPTFSEIDLVMRELNNSPPLQESDLSTMSDQEEESMGTLSSLPKRRSSGETSEWPGHRRVETTHVVSSKWPEEAWKKPVRDADGLEEVLTRVVQDHIRPLEKAVSKINSSSADRPLSKHSPSTIDSDADDEDMATYQPRRPISRSREKRQEQIKVAVLEALREEQARPAQLPFDLTALQSSLEEIQTTLAKTVSVGPVVADVRSMVEEVLERHLPSSFEYGDTQLMHRSDNDPELQVLRKKIQDQAAKRDSLEDELRGVTKALKMTEAKAEGLQAENRALQHTLDEYRLSSTKWRQGIDEATRERHMFEERIASLKQLVEEGHESSGVMKRRLEKLHADMATAASQLASEKALSKAREYEHRQKYDALVAAQAVRDRECQEHVEELRIARSKLVEGEEANRVLAALEQERSKLQAQVEEKQSLIGLKEREMHEFETSSRKTQTELEEKLAKARLTLETNRIEGEAALRMAQQANSTTVDELTLRYTRAVEHAKEDKARLEEIMRERLTIADARLQHSQERINYMQERLEIATTAAQAAAASAKSRSSEPEKISPQALRETICVLQEQLQAREQRIEKLQVQANPRRIKELQSEVNWLRELLQVRNEDLTELIATLSGPDYDRRTVRDAAVRIRASLEMEAQEKRGGWKGQAAAQISSAFNKWRSSMESSALKTPTGLMTPPASNVRASSRPQSTKAIPPPRLQRKEENHTSQSPLTPLLKDQSYDSDAQHRMDFADEDDFSGAEIERECY